MVNQPVDLLEILVTSHQSVMDCKTGKKKKKKTLESSYSDKSVISSVAVAQYIG